MKKLVLLSIPFFLSACGPTFELNKSEWVCSKSHNEINTTWIPVNKTLIPLNTVDEVCDQYERKK